MNSLFEASPMQSDVLPLSFAALDVSQVAQIEDKDCAATSVETAVAEACDALRAEMSLAFEQQLKQGISAERALLHEAATGFATERVRYFNDVEGEVVRLALAIANRILDREVKMDPVLLAGVVRVALSKLSQPDAAVLYVATEDLERWTSALKQNSALRVKAHPEMGRGACRLEAGASVAELGVEAQLAEIERGFFDLLERRRA